MFWVAPDVQKRAGYSIWTVKLERSPLPDIWAISSGATHSWQMWEICCSLAPGTSPATSSTHSPPSLHPLHFFIASLWLIFFCKGKSRKEVWSVEVCLLLVRRWVAEDACTALHLSLQNDFAHITKPNPDICKEIRKKCNLRIFTAILHKSCTWWFF